MSASDSHAARVDAFPADQRHQDWRRLHASGARRPGVPSPARGDLRLVSGRDSAILVAGADPARRAAVMGELVRELPASTLFEEAIDACTVLERAPSSRTVIVVGDLIDATSEAITQMLGHRDPQLPVVAVGQEEAASHDSRHSPPHPLRSGAC